MLLTLARSIDPVIYPAFVPSSQQCDLAMSNTKLHNILVKLNMDIPPSKTINFDSLIHSLFEEHEDIKSLYLNLTEFVTVTEIEQAGQSCHQNHSSAKSQQLMDVLQNISSKISAHLTHTAKPAQALQSFEDFNCTNAAVSSGFYFFSNINGSTVQVYCDMEGENCGGEGGWMRVAYVNMSDPGSQCPQHLNQEIFQGNVYCDGKGSLMECASTSFPVFNTSYAKVCGQVRGYQRGCAQSFENYYLRQKTSIDDGYVDGVSITHGNPRKHIWTYVAALTPNGQGNSFCPCNDNDEYPPPSFVGNDYYCESAVPVNQAGVDCNAFFYSDPLWDGKQCDGLEVDCCSQPNMPWFMKTLDQPATDDIELRICNAKYYDVPTHVIELNVK